MLKWFNKKKKDNKGFTLVELIIVVAILAILVGLLAPQYTKYVEKSRKTADANNLDEMVKIVKILAADPASELPVGAYTITMKNDGTEVTADTEDGKVAAELLKGIPSYASTKLKSSKWGSGGAYSPVTATITVDKDGGTTVTYTPDAMKDLVETGSGETPAAGGNSENP